MKKKDLSTIQLVCTILLRIFMMAARGWHLECLNKHTVYKLSDDYMHIIQ